MNKRYRELTVEPMFLLDLRNVNIVITENRFVQAEWHQQVLSPPPSNTRSEVKLRNG